MSSNLKHGDKVTLELQNWDDSWVKVEGEIVEEFGNAYLKHSNGYCQGTAPKKRAFGYYYWWLAPDEGLNWRFPQ
jgi:hypothetical protein